jgi:hypothetical protein
MTKKNKQKYILNKNAHLIDDYDKMINCNTEIDNTFGGYFPTKFNTRNTNEMQYCDCQRNGKEFNKYNDDMILLINVYKYIENNLPNNCYNLINEFINEDIISKYSYISNTYNKITKCWCNECKEDKLDYIDEIVDCYIDSLIDESLGK